MTPAELRERIGRYYFYHRIEVAPGVFTPGLPRLIPQQELVLRNLRSLPLAGKRVLDVGCRDGLLSFEAERLGASEVVGIDSDLSLGATEFLIPHLQSSVRMHEMNMFDLTPKTFGTFDVIIFSGVLYHLRYPFEALKLLRGLLNDGGTLLLETAVLPVWERHSLLYCPTGDESPYEPTSVTFFNTKGLVGTLESMGYNVVQRDRLYGPRLGETPGVGVRQRLIGASIWAQRLLPRLVRAVLGRFAIDRVVLVCKTAPADEDLTGYWDGLHRKHRSQQPASSPVA